MPLGADDEFTSVRIALTARPSTLPLPERSPRRLARPLVVGRHARGWLWPKSHLMAAYDQFSVDADSGQLLSRILKASP